MLVGLGYRVCSNTSWSERESTAYYFRRSACDAQDRVLIWTELTVFDGSTTNQQQYVCANAEFFESSEKVETLLGPGALSFNMYTPAEFPVNVNTQILV